MITNLDVADAKARRPSVHSAASPTATARTSRMSVGVEVRRCYVVMPEVLSRLRQTAHRRFAPMRHGG